MAVATITTLNGHVNGYHGGLGLDGATGPDIEPLTSAPIVAQSPSGPATAVATAVIGPQDRPAMSTAANAKSARVKSAGNQAGATGGGTAARKAKSARSKVKYVRQAELDRELAELEKLSQAVLAGDKTALDTLRSALDSCPHIWRRLADLQQLIDRSLLKLIGAVDPLRSEAFRKRWSEFRHHLPDDEQASLATKMAASRMVACWLFAQLLELRALESLGDTRFLKALVQAERRLQIALRTLSMARQADLQMQRLRS